ncbi:MAG: hypothetical protein GY851_35825, partial [bacterium]|nr:hypothetical protein [bacterium]
MSGGFSVSGLVSGLDWGSLVDQLMQIERQPIVRLQQRISTLEAQQTSLGDLRSQLQTLRNQAQNFRFGTVFDQFETTSSEAEVLTAETSGENPVIGSYAIEVLQMASATVASSSAVLGGAIDPNATLENSGISTEITAGDFTINGTTFSVDPATDTLNGILAQITASSAGVNATYDAASDTVVFTNQTDDDTSVINFGGGDDDSNFLSSINVAGATQFTNGTGETEVQSTRNLGAIDANAALDTVNFRNSGIPGGLSGSFRLNGVTITVDSSQDSLADLLEQINSSDAGVTASYDTTTDTIRVVSETLGSRTIGFTPGTSNFLEMTNLSTAVQEAGSDSQFTINGGAVQTRNTNEVTDAI